MDETATVAEVEAHLAEWLADRTHPPDRDYPVPAEWADGANPLARPHPGLPWVVRSLPPGSMASGDVDHAACNWVAPSRFPEPPVTTASTLNPQR